MSNLFTIKEELIELKGNTSSLIVVDMQNDFAHPNGVLFCPNSTTIIQPIKNLLIKAREKNAKIIYTKDTHYQDDPVEFPIWGKHVIKGEWGWEIIDELKPETNDMIIEKLRYDAFFGTPLDHVLRTHGIKNLVITGTVANICVLHTVSSAKLHNYNVIVPVDAISAITDFDYQLSLRQMDFLYKVLLTKEKFVIFD
ncbi:MAG: cysteine hydrolase [Candidatus Hydrogenedentes bacterium]|nr:cysteine hydrolase [Candidatus Hydrogenedentota bacterium]